MLKDSEMDLELWETVPYIGEQENELVGTQQSAASMPSP